MSGAAARPGGGPGAGPVEAVLFDLGGVFTASPFEVLRVVGEARGIAFEASLPVVFGPYDEDTDHPWHRAERGQLDLEGARREVRELGVAQGLDLDLFDVLGAMAGDGAGLRPDVVAVARDLRATGVRTALVTNNLLELRELWRALIPVDDLFDVVVDSCEVGVRKPDERIFRLALDALGGVEPGRAAFLDDYPGNVAAARRLGLRAILVGVDHRPALAELAALTGR